MIMYTGYSGTEKTILVEEDTDLDTIARSCIDTVGKYEKKALAAFEHTVEDMRDDPMSDYDIYDFGEMQPYATIKFPFRFSEIDFTIAVRETYKSESDSVYDVYVARIPARLPDFAHHYSLKSKSAAVDAFLSLLISITESAEAKEKEEFDGRPF